MVLNEILEIKRFEYKTYLWKFKLGKNYTLLFLELGSLFVDFFSTPGFKNNDSSWK